MVAFQRCVTKFTHFGSKSTSNEGARYQNNICHRAIVIEDPCAQRSLPFSVPGNFHCGDLADFVVVTGRVGVVFERTWNVSN